MVTYCYRDKYGKIHERQYHMGEAPALIREPDGTLLARDWHAEHARSHGNQWRQPLHMFSLDVHPSQVEEAREVFTKEGISTRDAYYKKDGTLHVTSREARNKVMKARGYRDNNAGYGDWAGDGRAAPVSEEGGEF